jgi:multidrug resistance efflux pump
MKNRILLFLLLLSSCGEEEQTTNEASPVTPVTVSEVVALGRIEPESQILALAGEVGGIISEINIGEGDSASKGAVIVTLRHEIEAAQLQLAKAQYQTQLAQVKSDQLSMEQAEVALNNQAKTLERLRSLTNNLAETQQTLDDAESAFLQQKLKVDQLNQVIVLNERRLAELQSGIQQAQARLNQKFIVAPMDGRVLRLDVIAGDAVTGGAGIGDFAPNSPTSAICEVDELFATQVEVGQPAYVRLFGETEKLASGKVVRVGAYLKQKSLFTDKAGESEDRRVREVRIVLDNAAELLYNTRVECVIDISGN